MRFSSNKGASYNLEQICSSFVTMHATLLTSIHPSIASISVIGQRQRLLEFSSDVIGHVLVAMSRMNNTTKSLRATPGFVLHSYPTNSLSHRRHTHLKRFGVLIYQAKLWFDYVTKAYLTLLMQSYKKCSWKLQPAAN